MNKEVADKLTSVREYIKEHELSGVLLNKATNFAWLSGGIDVHGPEMVENAVCSLLVTKDHLYVIGPCVETARMKTEVLPELEAEMADYPWHLGTVESKLREMVDPVKVASDQPVGDTIPLDMSFHRLKYAYCEEEKERCRWLGKETTACIEEVARSIRPGDTEYDVLARCNYGLWSKGIRPIVMYIAADERAMNYKHPLTIGKKVEKHMIFVIMTMKWGMMVALSRLVFFGSVPEEYRKKQDAVMKVDATYIANTVPGAIACDILKKGIDMYAAVGYDGYWKDQFQGGPTGYELRNYFTNLETREKVVMNQAFAWNPMINGLKSEDTFLVTPEGPEFVTVSGNWPMTMVSIGDVEMARNDILVL